MRYGALLYPVRLRVLLRQLGALLIAVAILAGVSAAVSLVLKDLPMGWRSATVALLLGGAGWLLSRMRGPDDVQFNEALSVVALAFLIAPLAMAYPLMASGLGFADALFEAVSGITTTGLSVTATLEGRKAAFLLTRAWMQWYGGLGFVALSAILVLRPGAGTRQLMAAEMNEEDLVGGTRAHARRVLLVYGAMTIAGVALLWVMGAGPLDAAVYTMAAVSTGGFASHDASLAALVGPARAGATILFIAGAIPFTLYWKSWRNGPRTFLRDPQLRALLVFGLAVSLLLLGWSWTDPAVGWSRKVGDAVITGFSAQTTTGFHTTPPGELANGPKLILILSMLVGGSAGSTAGGIKLVRILLFFRIFHLALARTALPRHAVIEEGEASGGGDPGETRGALLIVVLFGVALALSWLAFLATGHSPLDSLFDVASALGTVGLSTGVTGPSLAWGLKLVLCADMLLGRLEFVALLVLFYPRTWIGKRRSPS